MKPWTLMLSLLLCVGCGKSEAIVGKWQPVEDASGNKRIEFYSDGKCRLDLSGKYYEWKLSGRTLTLILPKRATPILAAVEFPDEEHMDYAPLDMETRRELPVQRLVRADSQ